MSRTHAEIARDLVRRHGTTFARDAGIDLADTPSPLWRLLVLTQLLSARIGSDIAVATARELFDAGWTTPQKLRASTWQQRVDALGRGGYRRYDESTSTRLDDMAALLEDRWHGDLRALRDEADGSATAIHAALQEFPGIGPTGAHIFLREVQAVWPQVRPYLDDLARTGAEAAGLPTDTGRLAGLVDEADVADLVAALVRVARDPGVLDDDR